MDDTFLKSGWLVSTRVVLLAALFFFLYSRSSWRLVLFALLKALYCILEQLDVYIVVQV